MDIVQLLDQLYDAQAQLDKIRLHYQDLRDSLIPPVPLEIKTQLDEIADEEKNTLEPCQEEINKLTEVIKAEVIVGGETVKGKGLIAVWNKGRENIDTKMIKGYAAAHPEILQFVKIGEPSVSIRRL